VSLLNKCLDFAQAPNPYSTIREIISGKKKEARFLSTEQVEEV
jgi:hypothetical protein